MKVIYENNEVKQICEGIKEATKFFGGNSLMARSLLARINIIYQAEGIKDIIAFIPMRFHKLVNKGKGKILEGYFAIDVKTIRDKWRIILELLDENENPFIPCEIDVVATKVRIIRIMEVSNHYE